MTIAIAYLAYLTERRDQFWLRTRDVGRCKSRLRTVKRRLAAFRLERLVCGFARQPSSAYQLPDMQDMQDTTPA